MKKHRFKLFFYSYRAKVLVAIVMLSAIASLGVSMIFLHQSTKVLEHNYTEALWARLSTASEMLDQAFQDAYDLTLSLCYDEQLDELLTEYEKLPPTARMEGNQLRQIISDRLTNQCNAALAVENIYIYLPLRKQVLTSDEYNSVREVFLRGTHQWITEPKNRGSLSPQLVRDTIRRLPQNILSYVRPIPNSDGQAARSIAVNMNRNSLIYRSLGQISSGESEVYYVVDPAGTICFAPAVTDLGRPIADLMPETESFLQDSNRLQVRSAGKQQIIASVTSDMTGYRIMAVQPRDHLMELVYRQRAFILFITLAVVLVVLITGYHLADRMYYPVWKLKTAMEAASGGDFSVRADIQTNDEIGQLAAGFNDMVSKIEGLIDQLVREQMQKKEAEIEALQYQITPHFMYNTLNSIKFAAYLQNAQVLGDQIGAFVELLQASISRTGDFITLDSEIHLVEDYIKLQNFRYMGRFDVSYDISECAKKCCVPRLLLQPLVENAILHGQSKQDHICHIIISGKCEGDILLLTIQDHGAGMTPEQIKALLNTDRPKTSGFSGIGVRNILERLHLYYGEKASLQYNSDKHGTEAVIQLPVSTNPDEYRI